MRKTSTAVARSDELAATPTGGASDRRETEFEVVCKLIISGRRWRARFNEAMKGHQQTDARWGALYGLADSPDGVIQSELADRLGVKGPSLVKLLDALEAQGLVKRRAAAGDRRANEIVLQPLGRQVLAQVDEIAAELRSTIFAEFTDHQLETTRLVLTRLAARLGPG